MLDDRESDEPLILAAKRGDAAEVERLLQAGADPDAQDRGGRTALHHACSAGQAATAACLLVYGADYALGDRDGCQALDPERIGPEALHAIRQRYHRFRRSDAEPNGRSSIAEGWAGELDRRGIVKVCGLVQPHELKRMQGEFDSFIRHLEVKIACGKGRKRHYFEEDHWWPEERAFITNNAFRHSAELARLACCPELVEAARMYLGRPPNLQRAVAMRYLAGASSATDMFHWHHDMEDKRFKVMVLLTDVGPGDQHMSYVCASHTLFHPYRMFFENGVDLDDCRRQLGTLEIYDALGNAGDGFLFDTNGAHRGVRRASGRVRDVYLIELNASAAHVWGGDVEASVLAEVRREHNPFERFVTAAKKWEMRALPKSSSWVESLPNVQAWL